MKRTGAALAIFPVILLVACATPKSAPERALYDLGRSTADASAASSAQSMRVTASLPGWLDTGDIAYRLA